MKRHAYPSLVAAAVLAILTLPELADAQRVGRAAGSRSDGRSSASPAASSGRIATRRSNEGVRSSTSNVRRDQAPGRARGVSRAGVSSGVRRGSLDDRPLRGGVSSAVQRGSFADRPGRASGSVDRGRSNDRGVVYPIQGRAYGTDRYYGSRDGWYYRSYPQPRYVSYGPRVYVPKPLYLRGCAFSFGYGAAGFGCIHTFAGPGLFVPFFYVYPRHVVHVHTSTSYATSSYAAPAYYDYDAIADDPTCAIVTVTQPGNDGYWKTLRLPLASATTRDQLRRLVSDRVRSGVAFDLVDADGVRIHVPAGLHVESVAVDPCR